jgi:hypothetical protein
MVFALLVLDSCHSAKPRVMKKSGPVELKKFIFPAKKTEVANVLRLSSRWLRKESYYTGRWKFESDKELLICLE